MTNAPDRIWIEDEFGDGDEDQWTYGTWDVRNYMGYDVEYVRADRIDALTAERDEAINQLDSAIHSQIVLEKRTAAVMEDRKFILEERDRTFALMLARAEAAEAGRDRLETALVYAKDYLDLGMEKMAFNVIRHALRRRSHE